MTCATPSSSVCDTYAYKYPGNAYSLECNTCQRGYGQCTKNYYDSCGQCPKGKYQSTTTYADCKTCAAGRYASSTGKTSCYGCAAGKTPNSCKDGCVNCPSGRSILGVFFGLMCRLTLPRVLLLNVAQCLGSVLIFCFLILGVGDVHGHCKSFLGTCERWHRYLSTFLRWYVTSCCCTRWLHYGCSLCRQTQERMHVASRVLTNHCYFDVYFDV